MPKAKKRFIAPLRDAGKGISRRPSTVAAITVCNQRISVPAQIINPEQCPKQDDFPTAEYLCKCVPGNIYNIIGRRQGVVVGGTAGLYFETPGGVVILNTVYFIEISSVGGVRVGGSARRGPDVTNLRASGGAVVNGYSEISTARPGGNHYFSESRGGVMAGGSARRGPDVINLTARGGAVVGGHFEPSLDYAGGESEIHTIYEAITCLCPASGIVAGGEAEVTSSAWMIQMECENVDYYKQVGDNTPCRLTPGFTCGVDGYNGFSLTTYLDWLVLLTDGQTDNSLLDGSKTLESAVLYVNGDTYTIPDLPEALISGKTLIFELSDPQTWRLYGTQEIRVDATVDGELFTWYGEQTFDGCPQPMFDNVFPTTNLFEAFPSSYVYNSEIDTTLVSLTINYPCYDGSYEIGELCWFAPTVGGCICTDTTLPVTIGPSDGYQFDFSLPGNWLGQTLYGNFLNISVNTPLNCVWTWFFTITIPNSP
jgi:hypothetical protein